MSGTVPPPPGDDTPPPPPPSGGITPPPPPPPAYGQTPVPGVAPNGKEYAQWIWRVLAYLIDYVGVFVLMIIANIFWSMSFTTSVVTRESPFGGGYTYTTLESSSNPLMMIIAAIFFIIGWVFYFWNKGYKEGSTGKSIGKGFTGYTTVKEETGEPLGVGAGCLRALLLIVDFAICYVGVLWPLWDQKRQCLLSDKATGAVVYKD